MSRYIDADALLEYWKPDQGRKFDASYFIHTIEVAPTIDFVRCAECRRVREDGGHANCGGYLYCRKWKTLVDEDCFCSWGERSE